MAYTQSLTATAALINQLAQEHEIPDESRGRHGLDGTLEWIRRQLPLRPQPLDRRG
jgi:hypothetical protein